MITKITSYCLALSLVLIAMGQVQGQKSKKFSTNGKVFKHIERSTNPQNHGSECPESEFRTIDGTCNNISKNERIEWGATDVQLYRNMPPKYGEADKYNALAEDNKPSARAVSNAICSQTEVVQSAVGLSSFVFTWGQFLDHDIDLTPEGEIEYEPIVLPADEPLFSFDIPFLRSEIYEETGESNFREQTNLITSWIDGSNVYGSEETRSKWLRTFQDGKMKVSAGNLLPFNTIDGQYESEIDENAPSMAGDGGGTVVTFVAGDVRAAEQPGLTSLHTLFLREHNRICNVLIEKGLENDEEIYQRARKEVGAIIQGITYQEFLPALGINVKKSNGYNPNVHCDIANMFATAAYRLGHTMVTDELLLLDDECQNVEEGSVALLDGFFNIEILRDYNIDPILKGLSVQVQNEVDTKIIDNLRNFLFGDPSSGNAFGLDLASLNIQRGRDHGLQDYNSVRKHYTRKSARKFSDITRDPALADALQATYGDINNIDVWVGLLAEDKLEGKSVGRTLDRMLKTQFEKLRDGDRFFYLHDKYLSKQDKERIMKTTLSDVIRANTELSSLQKDVFKSQNCDDFTADSGIENRMDSEKTFENFTINPNPAAAFIQVDLQTEIETDRKWLIYDSSGQIVRNFSSSQNKIHLDVSGLASGIYSLSVNSSDVQITKTFVKIE